MLGAVAAAVTALRGHPARPSSLVAVAALSSRLLRSIPLRFEDGFVAVSVFELDLDGAVVEKFGGSFAIDLVAFLAAGPVEADRVAGVCDFEAGLQGAEGDCAALRGDRQRRRAAQIEMSSIPEIGLDDPPSADQSAVGRGFQAEASRSFGSRARLLGGGCEGEGPSDAPTAAKLGSFLAADLLDPAEGFLDPLTDALAHPIARVSRRAAIDR